MLRVEGAIVIRRSLEEVFDFVADERNLYDPRTVGAEKVSPGPIGRGTRFRTETKKGRRTISMLVELRAYDRPHHLASHTSTRGMDIDSSITFEAVREDETRIRWISNLQPRGLLLTLLRPILRPLARRQMETIWKNLKRTLERERGNLRTRSR